MENVFEDLKFRGLINQTTNEKELEKKLKNEKIALYAGFDPTFYSLHLGNLLVILTLKRFQNFGHKPLVIVGGGTALIGDPSGKIKERELQLKEKIEKNKENLITQIKSILGQVKIYDNFEWLSEINTISFLRDYGKYFQVSEMINKESVKSRISNTGISFCEFSYMILQAIDFLKLFEKENCELQIGGSDQWGNIVCGIDLIKKIHKREVFGITLPLLLTKSGKKFGKTEKGAIYLDKNLTLPYQFYQYLINVADDEVIPLLKYFTFLSKSEILEIEKEHLKNPQKRLAQKILASELTKIVHGETELKRVERISEILFYGKLQQLKQEEIKEAFFNVPSEKISLKNKETLVLDILKEGKVVNSKSEAKRLIQQKGISINGQPILDLERKFTKSDALYGKYLLIKKGKKHYFLIEIE
jgi:tyrosyl-tRNA synthetase